MTGIEMAVEWIRYARKGMTKPEPMQDERRVSNATGIKGSNGRDEISTTKAVIGTVTDGDPTELKKKQKKTKSRYREQGKQKAR